MAATRLLVGVAFPFEQSVLAMFRAVSPRIEILATSGRDQAAVDEIADGNVEGLVAQMLPSDPSRTPRLRWLQILSAGAEMALARGPWPAEITLTNARGAYAGAIAQYTIGAILRIAEQVDRRMELQRGGRWPDDEEAFVGRLVRGQTLVIVGYGGIGREIARLARALGMRVLAVKARPKRRADDAFRMPGTGDPDGSIPERIVGLERLAEALAEADFVSITLPITPQSRGVVSREALAALRSHTWLINTGRGPVVDETALAEGLAAGRIGGAVLDVFGEEPLPPDSPFWRLPNVIVTPHVSGAAADQELPAIVAENLRRFAAGEPLLNQVDPERGY